MLDVESSTSTAEVPLVSSPLEPATDSLLALLSRVYGVPKTSQWRICWSASQLTRAIRAVLGMVGLHHHVHCPLKSNNIVSVQQPLAVMTFNLRMLLEIVICRSIFEDGRLESRLM